MLDETEKNYFESLVWEKINPIRERHFAELDKINPLTNPGNSPAAYTHKIRQFKRELAEARIQAYIETYKRVGRYPDEGEFDEFAGELFKIVDNKGSNLPRHFRGALSPYPAELVDKIEGQLSSEIRQDVGIALSSLHHFINEGKLEAQLKARQNRQGGAVEFNERFIEFQKLSGRTYSALSDLHWNVIKNFIEGLSSDIERVDFLKNLAKLPDDGVVNNIITNPPLHRRNQESLLRPLHDECSRLLSGHFDLEAILQRAEQTTDHGEALAYLWNVLRSYKKYHPSTLRGSYQPEELAFCKTMESEIQHRKDLQFSSLVGKETSMSKTEIHLSNSSVGVLNTGQMEDVKSISVNVSTLIEHGHDEIANALKELAEAVTGSSDISAEERSYLLENLEELSRQAALPPTERAKSAVIKSIAAGVGGGLSAAGGLAEVWSTWGPAIRAYFGY